MDAFRAEVRLVGEVGTFQEPAWQPIVRRNSRIVWDGMPVPLDSPDAKLSALAAAFNGTLDLMAKAVTNELHSLDRAIAGERTERLRG